jgi:hypothetical protein
MFVVSYGYDEAEHRCKLSRFLCKSAASKPAKPLSRIEKEGCSRRVTLYKEALSSFEGGIRVGSGVLEAPEYR